MTMVMTMVMLMMMVMMIDDYEDEEDNLTTIRIPLQRLERQPDERDKCRQTGTRCKWAKGGFFQMLPAFKLSHMMSLFPLFKLGSINNITGDGGDVRSGVPAAGDDGHTQREIWTQGMSLLCREFSGKG